MISTGKSSGYLNRCSEVAESFSDTFDQNHAAEVHQESDQGLQNALSYRANRNCVKRICELPVNNLDSDTGSGTCPIRKFKPKSHDPNCGIEWPQLCASAGAKLMMMW